MVYTIEYDSTTEKKDILTSAITSVNLEAIILNEVSQSDKYFIVTFYLWNLKNNLMPRNSGCQGMKRVRRLMNG